MRGAAAKRFLDMQGRPAFGSVFCQERDQDHRPSDYRDQAKPGRTSIGRAAKPLDPAVPFIGQKREGKGQHRKASGHNAWPHPGIAQRASNQGRRRIAKGISCMTEVHQRNIAVILQGGDARIHQHIGQTCRRPAGHHRQREHQKRGRLPRQNKGQRHKNRRHGQSHTPQGRPEGRGRQHRQNRRDRGEEDQHPKLRLIHAEGRFQIGQDRREGPPHHTHSRKCGQLGAGGSDRGKDSHDLWQP